MEIPMQFWDISCVSLYPTLHNISKILANKLKKFSLYAFKKMNEWMNDVPFSGVDKNDSW